MRGEGRDTRTAAPEKKPKITFKNYLFAGNGTLLAVKLRDSWGGDCINYLLADHLGSVSNITDSNGSSLIGLSFDAYGDRRGSNWTGDPSSGELDTINGVTRRGFTEHEMLDSVGSNQYGGVWSNVPVTFSGSIASTGFSLDGSAAASTGTYFGGGIVVGSQTSIVLLPGVCGP